MLSLSCVGIIRMESLKYIFDFVVYDEKSKTWGQEKAEHLRHKKKKAFYGLIAKKLGNKKELRAQDFLAWDIEDLSMS